MLEKIRQIKYSRLSDEERFFLETIDGIEPFKSDKYPLSIFWKKKNKILLEQDYKLGWLRVNYDLIWSVFETNYGHKYSDIQSLIKEAVDKHTNLESLTPIRFITKASWAVDKHTNLESLTPQLLPELRLLKVDKHTNLESLTPKPISRRIKC